MTINSHLLGLFALFSLSTLPSLAAEDICSPINHCKIKKINWGKKGWETVYKKELKFEKFCRFDRPSLQLEKELGLELWLFNGSTSEEDAFKKKPHVTANLYTYKLTHIVASASTSADDQTLNFTYRMTPKGSTIVEVTCTKI